MIHDFKIMWTKRTEEFWCLGMIMALFMLRYVITPQVSASPEPLGMISKYSKYQSCQLRPILP